MKRILTTTALVALMSGPVLAEGHSMDTPFRDSVMENEIRASDFIGSRVYVTEAEMEADLEPMNEASKDWEDIGEINDVLMNRDGSVQAILVDVGGFLGIGEKQVAVGMDKLKLVSDGDDADDYFIVFTGNRALVEEAPEFTYDREANADANMETAATDTEVKTEETAEAEVETELETNTEAAAAEVEKETEEATAEVKQEADEATTELAQEADEAEAEVKTEMAENDNGMMAPTIEREGYQGVQITEMTSEELTGAPVYDANDEWVGEVSELIVAEDGKITNAIVDVGGFLGIGEKPVSMDFQQLSIQKQVDGDDLRIYVGATEEELESMPAWEKK